MRHERLDRDGAQALRCDGLAVGDAAAVCGLRQHEQRRDRREPRLGGARGDADAVELQLGLASPAVVEEPLVDGQLDAVSAQGVRMAQRERRRHDGVAQPHRPRDPYGQGRLDLVHVDAVPDEVVGRERLHRDDLDRRVDGGDAIALDAPDDGDAAAVELEVAEGVADRDRDFVAQLRRPDGIADEEDVRHRR